MLVIESCLVENDNSIWMLDSGATNHVCSFVQETSSWKTLDECEVTLKVGTGDVVSAEAVGEMQLCFRDRYILLKHVLYVPRMKKELNIYLPFNGTKL